MWRRAALAAIVYFGAGSAGFGSFGKITQRGLIATYRLSSESSGQVEKCAESLPIEILSASVNPNKAVFGSLVGPDLKARPAKNSASSESNSLDMTYIPPKPRLHSATPCGILINVVTSQPARLKAPSMPSDSQDESGSSSVYDMTTFRRGTFATAFLNSSSLTVRGRPSCSRTSYNFNSASLWRACASASLSPVSNLYASNSCFVRVFSSRCKTTTDAVVTTTATAANAAPPRASSMKCSHEESSNPSNRLALFIVFGVSAASGAGIIVTMVWATIRLRRNRRSNIL